MVHLKYCLVIAVLISCLSSIKGAVPDSCNAQQALRLLQLESVKAVDVVELLKALMNKDDKHMIINAQPSTNALILAGDPGTIKEIENFIRLHLDKKLSVSPISLIVHK